MESGHAVGVVLVVEDDVSLRHALSSLIRSAGYTVQSFGSAEDWLQSDRPNTEACLILDVELPGMSGLELQDELARLGHLIPIIFISASAATPMAVQAMKAGAMDFLPKPFSDSDLLQAIDRALRNARASMRAMAERNRLSARYETLTPREREVMLRVVKGMLNKQIAAELNLKEITVKFHRRHVMEKMSVRSVADLVRVALILV
jgi:FixJ family two-component response regulator